MAAAARQLWYDEDYEESADSVSSHNAHGQSVRRSSEPQARPAEESLRAHARAKVTMRKAQPVSLVTVVGFGAVAVLALLVLLSYVQLMDLSTQTVELEDRLTELESEYAQLTAQYEEIYNEDAVRAAAEAAGMRKPNSSQIYYIDLSGGDSAEVYQPTEEESVFSAARDKISNAAEYFR